MIRLEDGNLYEKQALSGAGSGSDRIQKNHGTCKNKTITPKSYVHITLFREVRQKQKESIATTARTRTGKHHAIAPKITDGNGSSSAMKNVPDSAMNSTDSVLYVIAFQVYLLTHIFLQT